MGGLKRGSILLEIKRITASAVMFSVVLLRFLVRFVGIAIAKQLEQHSSCSICVS